MLPKVVIVVLNYNGIQHLQYSIPSILSTRYENLVLLVVDNASSDDSLGCLRTNFPSVQLLPLRKNLGWAGGNNEGVRKAIGLGAEYVVLANNDILIHPDWIGNAITGAQGDQSIGLVGFRGLSLHRDRQVLLECIAKPEVVTYEQTEFVTGWAMFVRASVFRRIGMIDEKYFSFGEETDFEHRMKIAGYRFVRVNTPLCHYSGGTYSRYPHKAAYLIMRNGLRFNIKFRNGREIVRLIQGIYWQIRRGKSDLRVEDGHFYTNIVTPSSRWVSTLLFFLSVLWNFAQLPITVVSGYNDQSKALKARMLVSGQNR